MQRIIRQSEIKAFMNCKRNWELSWHRNLSPRDETIGLSQLGTLVHEGIEMYYKYGIDPGMHLAEKLGYLDPNLYPKWEKIYDLAILMVDGYVEWVEETGADVGLRVVEVEGGIEVPFGTYDGDEVIITGKLDLQIYDEALDLNLLMDNKTVGSLEQAEPMLQMDFQLLTYAVLRKLRGDPVDGAIHNNLRRVKRTATAKPPFYGRSQVHFNDTQLRNHWRHMHGIITDMVRTAQAIEADPEQHQFLAPPNPTKDCSWRCPFYHACVMFDDGSNVEGYLANYYTPKEHV